MNLRIRNTNTRPHLAKYTEKYFWLGVLLLFGLLYYCAYVFSVIPPQTGWWQYMAQRVLGGELLYRDVFLYVPPYFAWLTAALYRIFGGNFFAFTLLGLLVFRALPWALSYLIMTRYAKPAVSAIGAFTSICVTSSYLVDQAYDYNPLVMMLALLQAYLLLRAYESKTQSVFLILSAVQGVLCGIQLMLKQNVGIIMPIVTLPILLYVAWTKDKKPCLWAGLSAIAGMLFAVLPGLIYLLVTQTIDDFWWCITTAFNAKMGEGSIWAVTIRNFIRWDDMIVAVLLCGIYVCTTRKHTAIKNCTTLLAALCGFAVATIYGKHLTVAIDYVLKISTLKIVAVVAAGIVVICAIMACYCFVKKAKLRLGILAGVFFASFLCVRVVFPHMSNYFADYFYYTMEWPSLKRHILYTLLYFDIFLWFDSLYYGAIQGNPVKTRYFIVNSLYMGFMAVSFASASLEELYALLLVPGGACALSVCLAPKAEEKTSEKISKAITTSGVLVIALCVCSLCLLQKLYIPYEWHSWRSESLLENETVSVEVEGLNGFKLTEKEANTYEQIISLIEENSNEYDVVYQFPNIPLFNVLSERKTLYVAIPYFDVCPDSLAIESAELLRENPPKLFVYANLIESRWYVHEMVFRDGKPSGQREIQKFYNEVVQNKYTLLGSFDNNEGESVEVWKYNEE